MSNCNMSRCHSGAMDATDHRPPAAAAACDKKIK